MHEYRRLHFTYLKKKENNTHFSMSFCHSLLTKHSEMNLNKSSKREGRGGLGYRLPSTLIISYMCNNICPTVLATS